MKINKMNKEIFKDNLLKTLDELSLQLNIEIKDNYRFIIIPVLEKDKPYSNKDDIMRLWVLSERNLKDRYFDLNALIKLFSGFEPYFPLWINVMLRKVDGESIVIELHTSLRFRKPSEIHNVETGHPPFRIACGS